MRETNFISIKSVYDKLIRSGIESILNSNHSYYLTPAREKGPFAKLVPVNKIEISKFV